jgi:hypothetical protein
LASRRPIATSAPFRGRQLTPCRDARATDARARVAFEALRAMRRGDYALATLALTMQVEGIVMEFLCNEKLIDVAIQRSGKNPVPFIRA